MQTEHVARLFEGRPGVLSGHMHFAEKDGDVSLGNVLRKNARRNVTPSRLLGLILPQPPVHNRSTVALNNAAILANDDALHEALVDKYLPVELMYIGVVPEDR